MEFYCPILEIYARIRVILTNPALSAITSFHSEESSSSSSLIRQLSFLLLVKSKSVDGTLANILEGKVSYTALTPEEIEIEKGTQKEKKVETGQRKVKSC